MTPEQIKVGTGWHVAVPNLYGFSVQRELGRTVEELAAAGQFRNRHISVAKLDDVLAAGRTKGYNVYIIRSPGKGFHHTVQVPYPLQDDLAETLSSVFRQALNPVPFGWSSPRR